MNELIKYFNNKYSKTYGKIAYPRTTLQIYRVYQAIKSYGINDNKLVKLLHNVKLPKPRNTEEWELYVYCLYNKDDSEMVIDTSNLISKENPVFTGSISLGRKEGSTIGGYSAAIGYDTEASADQSHAEGSNTIASCENQHVQGRYNIEDAEGKYAHIVGNGTDENTRSNAHTLDWKGNAWYAGQVEGTNLPYTVSSKKLATVPANDINNNIKLGNEITVNNISINKDKRYYIEFLGVKKLCSLMVDVENGNGLICSINNYKIEVYNDSTDIIISINKKNNDIGDGTLTDLIIYEEDNKYLDSKYLETDLILQNSISLGRVGDIGAGSSAIGYMVEASGLSSHAEGEFTLASGPWSHAEGEFTLASGDNSHAEGITTTASGNYSHAEGGSTTASGENSHAEGYNTTASGTMSHAEGNTTIALGKSSHAEGLRTKASSEYQHVQGKFNIEDTANKYAHIVGNGENNNARSNAHTLDWEGNAWYAGKLSQDGTPTDDKDLITKKYVDDSRDNLISSIYGNNIYNFQITEDEFNSLCNLLYNGGNNKIALNSISSDTLNAIIDGDAWYSAISFNKKIILKIDSTGSRGLVLYTKNESTDGYVSYGLLSLKSNESNIVTISPTNFIEYNYNDKIINLGILDNNEVNIEETTKNQYINATKDFELVLPNVTEYIEIHLYLTSSSTVSITFPPSIKWKDVPTIEANKVYEIIFKYINEKIGWIGEYKIYN